jgi:hypothetical protein
VTRDELSGDHALELVFPAYADQSRDSGTSLPILVLLVAISQPQRITSLINENVVLVIGHRPADGL